MVTIVHNLYIYIYEKDTMTPMDLEENIGNTYEINQM